MKKYVKPEVFFEKFEVSQQIATCEYDSNNTANDSSCVFSGNYEGTDIPVTIFLDSNSACEIKAEGGCYHGSSGDVYNIFNS